METGMILNLELRVILGIFLGYIGIMEKTMETTKMGYIGSILGYHNFCTSRLGLGHPRIEINSRDVAQQGPQYLGPSK